MPRRTAFALGFLLTGCGPGIAETGPPAGLGDAGAADPSASGDPGSPPGDATGDPTDPGTPPTDPAPAACSGLPGLPGTTDHALPVGGVERRFRVHVPDGLDPNLPVPVVFAFHGYTMDGPEMEQVTGWDAVADREGFVVLYPDGDQGLLGGPWNVGSGVCGAGAWSTNDSPDFDFVVAMLDKLGEVQCVDQERVFAVGFSMGGYFAHHLACAGPVPLRAMAAHSAGTYDGPCANGPVPVMVLHGDADPLIDPACGERAAAAWLERDACPDVAPVEVPVAGGSCAAIEGCADGTAVSHCSFDGMDHGWAGSTDPWYGGGARYEDAAALAWSFFARF